MFRVMVLVTFTAQGHPLMRYRRRLRSPPAATTVLMVVLTATMS
jgi:hypothetical protein